MRKGDATKYCFDLNTVVLLAMTGRRFCAIGRSTAVGEHLVKHTVAILVFDGAEEMDFVGPLEVLAAAAESAPDWEVALVSESREPITCEKSMQVIPHLTFADLPAPDVVVIPGGSGARRQVDNPKTIQWLQSVEPSCKWMTSVCTGAFLLVGSGLARGKEITTHHRFIDRLKGLGDAKVVEGVRFVRDGKLVSAGGVMSGIEMSIWLVSQIWGDEAVENAKDYIAYDHPARAAVRGVD